MSKEFDITNREQRVVVCISNSTNVLGGKGGNELEINKEYHVTKVEMYGWHTEVFLSEFPDETLGFNSVLFNELHQDTPHIGIFGWAGPRRQISFIDTLPQILEAERMHAERMHREVLKQADESKCPLCDLSVEVCEVKITHIGDEVILITKKRGGSSEH